jgi:hypothetical protein
MKTNSYEEGEEEINKLQLAILLLRTRLVYKFCQTGSGYLLATNKFGKFTYPGYT